MISKPLSPDSTQEEVDEWLFEIGFRALTPIVTLSVSEWADTYRVLSGKTAKEPGPWRTSRTPYLKAIMDALSPDSPYQWIIFQKGSQIGGSEVLLNWMGYVAHMQPRAMMIVWPIERSVKDNIRLRVRPMVEATPNVRAVVGVQDGPKDPANNLQLIEFPGGFWAFAQSNSTPDLKSKPICYIGLDELDEFPMDANQQGDPMELAEVRTNTFEAFRKIYANSTPTNRGESRIELEFLKTDQRRYFVPCPFCGCYQKLVWEGLVFTPENPYDAFYRCCKCGGEIQNHHKSQMLERGEWRPTARSENPKAIGFHLSALYSPVGMLSWGAIAAKFTACKQDATKIKAFWNTILGESYEQKGETPDWERLYSRREGYPVGTLPEGVLFLTAGADVQQDRIEVEVVGWGRNKESWSIEYWVFPGDSSDLDGPAWQGLRDLLSKGYQHPTGVVLQIQSTAVDSGYRTQTVYNWARDYEAPKVIVTKGEDSGSTILRQPRAADLRLPTGKEIRRAVKVYPIGVSVMKHELYDWLRLARPDDGKSFAPGYCHFPEHNEEYFKQLCSEQWIRRSNKSTTKQTGEWKKVGGRERNEALDCRILARAAAAVMRIDLFSGADWDRLELAFGSVRERRSVEPANPANGPQARPTRSRYRSRGRG